MELSNEVWLSISHFMDSPTLAALSSVSKRFFSTFQPLLYHTLSAQQFQDPSFALSLRSTEYGNLRKASIRQVTIQSYLGDPTEEVSLVCGPLAGLTRHTLESAYANSENQWAVDVRNLRSCNTIADFGFILDSNLIERARTGSLPHLFDKVFMPTAAEFLRLPFVQSLRHLSISSPNGQRLDYGALGHLILASTRLARLSLHLVDATSLFGPVLQRMSDDPTYRLPLTHLAWNELVNGYATRTTALTLDEFAALFMKFPALCRFSLVGSSIKLAEVLRNNGVQSTGWSAITELTIEQRYDQRYMTKGQKMKKKIAHAHTDLDIKDLNSLFPSLRHLNISLPFNPTIPIEVSWLKMTHITYTSKDAGEDYFNFEQLNDLMNALTRASFAPCLQQLIFRFESDERYDLQYDAALCTWLKACEHDLDGVADSLSRIVVEAAPWRVVYERQRDGSFDTAFTDDG